MQQLHKNCQATERPWTQSSSSKADYYLWLEATQSLEHGTRGGQAGP